jgi:hypothetical protein
MIRDSALTVSLLRSALQIRDIIIIIIIFAECYCGMEWCIIIVMRLVPCSYTQLIQGRHSWADPGVGVQGVRSPRRVFPSSEVAPARSRNPGSAPVIPWAAWRAAIAI